MNFKPFAIAFCILLAAGQVQAVEAAAPARQDVTFHDVMDPASGMVMQRVPLPKGWRIDKDPNNEVEMAGPDNIIVYKVKPETYVYSNDPFTLDSARMMGKEIHPVISLKEYLNRYLVPEYTSQGHRFIKSYPIPEIADKFETITKLVPKINVQRRTIHVLGTEWEVKDGRRAFVLLAQFVSQFRGLDHWVVNSSELVAPRERFEYARDAIIYASANIEMNPKFVIYSNNKLLAELRRNNEAMQQSQRAHLQRMNAIAARGRASASIAKTYSDIADINHAGYLKRNDMVNAGHSKTIDSIGDRSVITNSATNEQYRVNSGSSFYWVNNNGEYIGTDNSLFDPRTQQGLNSQDWKKFEVAK
jgi:hypothetical protein